MEITSGTEGDLNLSTLRGRWQKSNLGEEAWELLRRDAGAYLQQSLSTPCLNALKSAKGAWLEDLGGRRYLDFHGNNVHQIGYGHPTVIAAIKAQLEELPFCPRRYTNEPAVRLAEELAERAPGNLNKVLFAPGGAAAISIALKVARLATGRYKTLSMWDSFHGSSLDAISISGEAMFRADSGPLMPGAEHAPPPDPRRCPFDCNTSCSLLCANYVEYVLAKEGDIAAVIAEPVRCTTVTPPPPGYWRRIREACGRHGALLIFDEIPTCLGRTGHFYASDWAGVEPDILVLGKGLGGAVFPLAGIIAHEDLDVAVDASVGHFTHEKSPVGAAAGLATLQVIDEEELLTRSQALGDVALSAMKTLAAKHVCIYETRGVGLLLAIELDTARRAEEVLYACLSKGLSFKVSSGTVLTLTPPLNILDSELDQAFDILDQALVETQS